MIVHFILDCSPEFLLAHFMESCDVLGFGFFRQQQQISGAALPASPDFSSNEIRIDILRKAQKAETGEIGVHSLHF